MKNYILNLFALKCPRCYKGELFTDAWYKFGKNTHMKSHCPSCGIPTSLEPGFYYGTGYVSYILTVAFSITTFVIWLLVTGIGFSDARIFWWLGANTVVLILLQPWFMRLSRILWLSWFLPEAKTPASEPEKIEEKTESN